MSPTRTDRHSRAPLADCCAILRDSSVGALLVEARGKDAAVAAGDLTCFGGKREAGEEPQACVLRECREELGWEPAAVERACDLYVDGELIAWFYEAAAPARDAALICEPGRAAVWLDDVEGAQVEGMRLSPWHACVLSALRAGERRADFASERAS